MKINKICFDIDGVICSLSKNNNYKKSRPIQETIKLINSLYNKKIKIILFTSRFMGRTGENKTKAKKIGYEFTKNQLKSWGLNYHKLIMGKPSYDLVVDDKSLFFKKKWQRGLINKINRKK